MRLYLLIGAMFLLAACTLGGTSTEGDGVCSAEERFAGNSDDCIADFSPEYIGTVVSIDEEGNTGLSVFVEVANKGGNYEGDVAISFTLQQDGQGLFGSNQQTLTFTGGNEELGVDFEVSEGVFSPIITYEQAGDGIAVASYTFGDVDLNGEYQIGVIVNADESITERDYTNNNIQDTFEYVPEPVETQLLIEDNIGTTSSAYLYQGSYVSKQVNEQYSDYYSANYQNQEGWVYVNVVDYKAQDPSSSLDYYKERYDLVTKTLESGEQVAVYMQETSGYNYYVWQSGQYVVFIYEGGFPDTVFKAYLELLPSDLEVPSFPDYQIGLTEDAPVSDVLLAVDVSNAIQSYLTGEQGSGPIEVGSAVLWKDIDEQDLDDQITILIYMGQVVIIEPEEADANLDGFTDAVAQGVEAGNGVNLGIYFPSSVPPQGFIGLFPSSVCGNAIVEGNEACDDGNLLNGDGCSDTCQLESFCGDGIVDADEDCDLGLFFEKPTVVDLETGAPKQVTVGGQQYTIELVGGGRNGPFVNIDVDGDTQTVRYDQSGAYTDITILAHLIEIDFNPNFQGSGVFYISANSAIDYENLNAYEQLYNSTKCRLNCTLKR